jgi:hypothetical protein
MILKWLAFLVAALMLAGCCALGNGCAPEAGAPIAWDGLGSAPGTDAPPVELQPAKRTRAKKEIILGPLDAAETEQNGKTQPNTQSKDQPKGQPKAQSKTQPKGQWEQQQAVDQEEDARLRRQLMICRTC